MKESIKNYGNTLKYLCGEFIHLLDNAKNDGIITEEEYRNYLNNKKEFLERFNKH